jgi:hypothetical protein
MSEPVFLLALAIVGTTVGLVVKTIAGAISGRRSQSDVADLREQLDEHARALDDAHNSLANQAAQLAELQERLDFAERILTQGRDRTALRPGEPGAS